MPRTCLLPVIAVAALLASSTDARADRILFSVRDRANESLSAGDDDSTFLELEIVSSPSNPQELTIPDFDGVFDLPIFDVEGALEDNVDLADLTGGDNLRPTPDLEIVITDPDTGESDFFEIEDAINGILEDSDNGVGVINPENSNLSNRTTVLGKTSFMLGGRTYSIVPSDSLFNRTFEIGSQVDSMGRLPVSGLVTFRVTVQGTAIPEPSTMALAAVGGLGVAGAMLRRRRRGA